MTGRWELTGVPYTSMRRPGGIADAIRILRANGLAERLEALAVTDAGDLTLIGPSGERGPSGLLNEAALVRLVEATRERVQAAHRRGRRPLLVGGDCPVILGALAAMTDEGDVGLVMLDGHEDAWPPTLSATGEASDSELALALRLTSEQLPARLDRLVPLLHHRNVALLGPRDSAEIAAGGACSIRDEIALFLASDELEHARPEEVIGAAVGAIEASAFWLHVDLDVLNSEAFAAVDYPQAGGLEWEQLERLASTATRDAGCLGASIVIYNPDLDPDRSASRMVIDFACRLVEGS